MPTRPVGSRNFGGSGKSHSRLEYYTLDLKAEWKKRNQESLEGYIPTFRFESMDEIKEYVSGEAIPCLICGKECRALGKHLEAHGLNSDQYREVFNIPFSIPLVTKDLLEAAGKRMTAYNESETLERKTERLLNARAAARPPRRISELGKKEYLRGVRKSKKQPPQKKIDCECLGCATPIQTAAFIIKQKRNYCKDCAIKRERESWNRYSARNREQKREYQKKYYKRNKPNPKAEDV